MFAAQVGMTKLFAHSQERSLPRRLAIVAAWLYVCFLLGVWTAIHWGGDRWWWATVLLFLPRWVFALPLLALVPVATIYRRKMVLPVALAVTAILFPITGLCVPWRVLLLEPASGLRLRVMTVNVRSGDLDSAAFKKLVVDARPDIIAFQEADQATIMRLLPDKEWHVAVALASRFPIHSSSELSDDGELGYWGTIVACHEINTPHESVDLCVVHLETPRDGLLAVYHQGFSGRKKLASEIVRRATISSKARDFLSKAAKSPLVLGDFNMPTDSVLYQRDWAGFGNAFSMAGWGWGHTARHAWVSLRIDHILLGSAWQAERCWVGRSVGSDHAPLIADVHYLLRE